MNEQNRLEIIDGGRDWRRELVARSAAMQDILRLVEKIAPSDLPVVIEGETGVGKEVVARALHEASGRAGPFVGVNCAALPATLAERELFGHVKGAFTGADQTSAGVFEQAQDGTLLLDEVADLDLLSQAKVLRALELGTIRRLGESRERSVRVRVIAATNRSLERDVEERRFRVDLYYRLAGVTLVVPPIRERPEDIAPLTLRFMREAAAGKEPSVILPETLKHLEARSWPGNIRELRLAVRRAVVLGGRTLTIADFPPRRALTVRSGDPPGSNAAAWSAGKPLKEIEGEMIARAMKEFGSIREAARALNMPRSTFADRLKRCALARSSGE